MGSPRIGAVSNAVATSASVAMTHYVAPNQSNHIVFIRVVWTGTGTVNAITFNGVNIASNTVSTTLSDGTSTAQRNLRWYYIKGSDIGGTGDLSLSVTFSASNKWSVCCISLDHVDQTTPFGTAAIDVHSGTDTGVSCAPASSVGNLILVGFASGTGTPTKGTGLNQIEQLISNDTWGATAWVDSADTSTAVDYTYASNASPALIQAFEVRGASGTAPLVAVQGNSNRAMIFSAGPEKATSLRLQAGNDYAIPVGCSTEESGAITGLSTRAPFAYAGTFRNLTGYVSINTCSASTTLTLYSSTTSTIVTLTVPAGYVGPIIGTGSYHCEANEKMGYNVVVGAGTGELWLATLGIEFAPDDLTKTITYLNGYSTGDSSAISYPTNELTFSSIYGTRTFTNGTEALAWVRAPFDAQVTNTAAELYTITAGSRHTQPVVVGFRKNGADGNASWSQSPITTDQITAFDTGVDDVVVGDKINFFLNMDPAELTGRVFGIESFFGHMISSNRMFALIAGRANGVSSVGPAVTRYMPPAGEQVLSSTEAPVLGTIPFKCRLFRFWAEVVSNTTTGGTAGETNNVHVYLRKNGVRTALRLEIPRASGTGNYYQMDCWNVVDADPGDTICYEIDCSEPASNSLRFTSVGIVGTAVVNSLCLPRAQRAQHMLVR